MTPGDYIFTGGYFAGSVAMIWLHYARKAARMGCKDSWLPWRAIRRLRDSTNPADQLAYYAGHSGFDVDPALLERLRRYCDEPVPATPHTIRAVNPDEVIDSVVVQLRIPYLTNSESTATLADHSTANAVAYTAPDDATAATRPPGDQQHASASASSAVAEGAGQPAPSGSNPIDSKDQA